MKHKKAAIEIEFNWVFVLVAGTFIFLFFFSVIQFAKKSSENSASITISRNLDAILTGAATAEDTVYPFTLPNKDVYFTCDAYRVGDSEKESAIRNKLIFAPSYIKGGQVLAWSISWDVPFKVTNFLFVTSPQIRYIFIGDEFDDTFRYFEDMIPKEFNAEFNPSVIENLNNYKVRFIYIGERPDQSHAQIFKSMPAEDVTALSIIQGDDVEISFYKKTQPGVLNADFVSIPYSPEYSFSDYISLIAAAITEDPENFECNMAKAFKRFAPIAKIYSQRSIGLSEYYQNDVADDICAGIHSQAASIIDGMIDDAGAGYFGTITLMDKNMEAQQNSCAMIY